MTNYTSLNKKKDNTNENMQEEEGQTSRPKMIGKQITKS